MGFYFCDVCCVIFRPGNKEREGLHGVGRQHLRRRGVRDLRVLVVVMPPRAAISLSLSLCVYVCINKYINIYIYIYMYTHIYYVLYTFVRRILPAVSHSGLISHDLPCDGLHRALTRKQEVTVYTGRSFLYCCLRKCGPKQAGTEASPSCLKIKSYFIQTFLDMLAEYC